MIDNDFKWLLNWYYEQFKSNWDYGRVFKINTVDNPGWRLTIDLGETELQSKCFQDFNFDDSEHNWIQCFIRDSSFEGAGGPYNLPEILSIFRNWVESCKKDKELKNVSDLEPSQLRSIIRSFFQIKTGDNHFMWLIKWFHSQCNGDWEHMNMVLINAIDPGWYVRISIDETEFDDIQFPEVVVNRSEDDWIHCFISKREFIGLGGPSNLLEILQIFRNWSESCPESNFSEETQ